MRESDPEVVKWLQPLLLKAYNDARRNKRYTLDEQRFERHADIYLAELLEEIERRTYLPSRSVAFIVRKPVIREIFAAPFRDRVIHHLLFNLVNKWWDRRFIHDSYSCRKGKGVLFAVNRLDYHIRAESENYSKETYVLKLDIRGYFMSLPRDKLFEAIEWGLARQFDKNSREYRACRFLWDKIIFDDPTVGVRLRGSRRDWEDLPKAKSLFHAKPGCGIVIGNLTSQLLSNVYLDSLDRYVTQELGLKHYGRYVDDFYMISQDKAKLVESISKIRDFLEVKGLVLHPNKIFLQEISRGVPFLGAVVYPHRIQVGRRVRHQIYLAAARYRKAGENELPMSSDEAVSLVSYYGLTKYYAHQKMWKKMFEADFYRSRD